MRGALRSGWGSSQLQSWLFTPNSQRWGLKKTLLFKKIIPFTKDMRWQNKKKGREKEVSDFNLGSKIWSRLIWGVLVGRRGCCVVADNKGYAAVEEASLKGKYTKWKLVWKALHQSLACDLSHQAARKLLHDCLLRGLVKGARADPRIKAP